MQVQFGDFVLDTDTRELMRESLPVHLSPKAFQLLELLLAVRPKALSKEMLFERLWPETFVVEANLSNLVGELRSTIGDDARHPRFVRTIHGFGYAFREPQPVTNAVMERHPAILFQLVWEGGRAIVGAGEHVLGREPSVALCVDSPSVSRRHARLRIGGGEAILQDLGSKNGTFVNGQRITAAVSLSDQDQICIGSVQMKFRTLTPQPSTETMHGRQAG